MRNPAISVVMPVYNGERFVAEAVESVLSQTFGDFEFIVVDDGSTDGTIDIVQAYRRDARVIVQRQPRNMGVREALNAGCISARGDLVARMDADDVSLPDRFAQQKAFLDVHTNIGVLGTALEVINETGQRRGIRTYPTEPALLAWLMLFGNCCAHPTVMIRRGLLKEVGYYPANHLAEDYALFLALSRRTRLANLPDVLLHYRVSGQNITHKKYEALESDAAGSLRDSVSEWWSIEMTEDQARLIRGLSTDRYPQSALEAQSTSEFLGRLATAFIRDTSLSQMEITAVKRDAAVRMWLVAAISLPRSPGLSATIAWHAIRLSPLSPFLFGRKVLSRLLKRLRRPGRSPREARSSA